MAAKSIGLLQGDGIGPEITSVAREVVSAAVADIEWVSLPFGLGAFEEYGTPVPQLTIDTLKELGVAIQGPVTSVPRSQAKDMAGFRQLLGVRFNVRVAKHYVGVPSKYPGINLVLIRDVVEDIGQGTMQGTVGDVGIAVKFTSPEGSEAVAKFAFDLARSWKMSKLTVASQSKVLRTTDGLYLKSAARVAEDYPDIEFTEQAVDDVAQHLVQTPEKYGVILSPRAYGGILSGLAAGLIGSVGMMPGMSLSDDLALFEASHGSAPHYAGMNKVNPSAMILAGAMLLRHIGEQEAALRVERAVASVVEEGKTTTYDLGGSATTEEYGAAVIKRLQEIQ
ncbi:MAG: isocitrate/isopropylmalate family dehydrogenase [Acidimicrobiales bacterium]